MPTPRPLAMTKNAASATRNSALFRLRTAAGFSQQEVADQINALAASSGHGGLGATANAISRWERGTVIPGPLNRRLLAQLFGVAVEDLGMSFQHAHAAAQRGHPNVEQAG